MIKTNRNKEILQSVIKQLLIDSLKSVITDEFDIAHPHLYPDRQFQKTAHKVLETLAAKNGIDVVALYKELTF
jgi:hypothetical protein